MDHGQSYELEEHISLGNINGCIWAKKSGEMCKLKILLIILSLEMASLHQIELTFSLKPKELKIEIFKLIKSNTGMKGWKEADNQIIKK